jgi:hypothetical protein
MWSCQARGCPRQYKRSEAGQIADHLNMHLAMNGPRASVPLMITPELCRWWLENTRRRRPITEAKWRKVAMDLEDDGWIYDGNNFGLDTDGNLVQGGHRATAIADVGVDVESSLIGGLPREAGYEPALEV